MSAEVQLGVAYQELLEGLKNWFEQEKQNIAESQQDYEGSNKDDFILWYRER